MSRASPPATKFPTRDAKMKMKNALLTSRSRSARSQAASSGRFRRCCGCQNMNAHQAVSEKAHTPTLFSVIGRTSPRNRSARPGPPSWARARAVRHSSGSGTLRRIQNTRSAGTIPTRKTVRVGRLANR